MTIEGQSRLTARETEVLVLIVGGSTDEESAAALGLSPRTVEFHRANIMEKLAVKNTAQLMQLVYRAQIG